jgi:hypothetical protein
LTVVDITDYTLTDLEKQRETLPYLLHYRVV